MKIRIENSNNKRKKFNRGLKGRREFIQVPLSHSDKKNNSTLEYLVLDDNLDKDEENPVHTINGPSLEELQEAETHEEENNQ